MFKKRSDNVQQLFKHVLKQVQQTRSNEAKHDFEIVQTMLKNVKQCSIIFKHVFKQVQHNV